MKHNSRGVTYIKQCEWLLDNQIAMKFIMR